MQQLESPIGKLTRQVKLKALGSLKAPEFDGSSCPHHFRRSAYWPTPRALAHGRLYSFCDLAAVGHTPEGPLAESRRLVGIAIMAERQPFGLPRTLKSPSGPVCNRMQCNCGRCPYRDAMPSTSLECD